MQHGAPWGKTGDQNQTSHHLAHHCADVAACFEAILMLPVMRARMEEAAGGPLSATSIARLAVLAFLHDAGKLHPGFQAKGWPQGIWRGGLHGHVREGAAIFSGAASWAIARNLRLDDLAQWGVDEHLLFSVLAHHGRPFRPETAAGARWQSVPALNYDPIAASVEVGALVRRWFEQAFLEGGNKLPSTPDFQHLLCGLVSLADWLGSTRKIFEFVPVLDADYMDKARGKARKAVAAIGLDVRRLQALVAGRTDFAAITGIERPRAQQRLVGEFPLEEQLVILEAETGSGKTEAALWRFARLFEAGLVDGLYFALPTRAAAIQLHRRVNKAIRRFIGEDAPEAVLAVPGYLKAGEAEGEKLPGWVVRWDDDDGADERKLLARWAAESAKRSLAATIAVGTVDQAMLAALQVKHAHLRAAALARCLLVIDEVHASDRYMSEVQNHLLRMHLGRGGHAMLMSATLGSVARAKWLGLKKEPSFEEAVAAPYPAVWGKGKAVPCIAGHERQKTVGMALLPSMAAEEAARLAIDAARKGARVLVIRNTVAAAINAFEAVRQADEALLLSVANSPALHHGRFAPEDRELLDSAVEAALSPRERKPGGVIVIGTQTLEQSLDIDADFLLTDLCPVDVLLQRIGRLHRHRLARPAGFERAQCYVMTPEMGLAKLLAPAFENGLGAWKEGGVLNGIYRDISGLELTRQIIETYPEWTIPAMNRHLVESATHPQRIEALNAELGKAWEDYSNNIYGKDVAEAGAARGVALPIDMPFADVLFPDDEEKIRTRLGAEGAQITFTAPALGPFGVPITCVTLPARWSRGIDVSESVEPMMTGEKFRFRVGNVSFVYDRRGLTREKS
jgi:CRISPR-associated endonuclease/helicase Cas3